MTSVPPSGSGSAAPTAWAPGRLQPPRLPPPRVPGARAPAAALQTLLRQAPAPDAALQTGDEP